MALIPASTAAKTASASIAATTQTSPDSILISEFQYLFDTIQATATAGQTSLVFDLTTLSHVSADITSVVNYLIDNGYQVINNGSNYTITWGSSTTTTTPSGTTVTTINPITPPSLITALAPTNISVTSGTPISISFTPSGGVPPYTYSGASTVNGLTFSSGILSGTPEVPTGSFTFSVGVTDSQGQTFSQLITVQATAPAITGITPTTVQGEVGIAFVATFYPVGGIAPYTFTTTGLVPSGLSFSSGAVNSITLAGTPDTPGNDYSTLVIHVVDSLNQTYTQTISWTITRTTGYAVSTTNILGGVIIPAVSTSGITNSFGTIGLATASTTQLGAIKIDNATLQFNGSGQLAIPTTSAMAVTSGTSSLTVSASNGSYWKFTPNGNFTLNFTVPTTDGLVKQTVFILLSTSAYQLSSTQVNSNVATVKWLNGSVPSFGSNSFYKLEYTFLYTSGQLTVLGKWEIYQ